MCRIKIKVPTTFTEAMNSEYSEEWLNTMKLEIESIKGDEVAVLTSLSNVRRNTKVISTKWGFRVKPDERFKARLVALEWRHNHVFYCGTTFVSSLDLLVFTSAKSQYSSFSIVLPSWFIDKNKLKSTIDLSRLYRVKEYSCSSSKSIK